MTNRSTEPMPLLQEKPLLMLMDGHAMVHRAWHAIQAPLTLRTTNEDVRGVFAFANTFIRAIQEWRPTHCAIAFDMSAPTFRHVRFGRVQGAAPRHAGRATQPVPVGQAAHRGVRRTHLREPGVRGRRRARYALPPGHGAWHGHHHPHRRYRHAPSSSRPPCAWRSTAACKTASSTTCPPSASATAAWSRTASRTSRRSRATRPTTSAACPAWASRPPSSSSSTTAASTGCTPTWTA